MYLSGAVRKDLPTALGVILTPNMGNRPDLTSRVWAADTGCYSRGDSFQLETYLTWLSGLKHYQATCLFATAPDVVGNAVATWERSLPVLPVIRSMGYRAALCAQNGIVAAEVDWDAFDVLFIGGDTAWKLSTETGRLCWEAKRHGKHVHMGRVNSRRRLSRALAMGCDSVDGTYIAFRARGGHGGRGAAEVLAWFHDLSGQLDIEEIA